MDAAPVRVLELGEPWRARGGDLEAELVGDGGKLVHDVNR